MGNTQTATGLGADDVARLKSEAVRGQSYAPRVSLALAMRLLDTSDPDFDPYAVFTELEYLEGFSAHSSTKDERPFDHPPLHPLWHKHFFSARHLMENIATRWNLSGKGNRDLDDMIREIARDYGEHPELWQRVLAHRLIVEGYEQRAARGLTGDWIIYAKHGGANYYLDLATHEEGVPDKAEQLMKKLRDGCFAEFPFVFRG